MKNLLYIITLLFFFSSCEDVIDVEVTNGEPRLVIDASFEYYGFESPSEFVGGVRLSLSSPFFENETIPVNQAQVSITNTDLNETITFRESSENGFYLPTSTIPAELNSDYLLTVIYNDETYEAVTQLIPTVPIDDITRGDGTLFENNEREVTITYTDDASREDFYLFDFDFDLFCTNDDRFNQGKKFSLPYFYEDVEDGDILATIKISGITKQHFTYFNQLLELIGQKDSDGPFETPPTTLRGNIKNVTNPDNFPLGYFNMSETYRMDFLIEEN